MSTGIKPFFSQLTLPSSLLCVIHGKRGNLTDSSLLIISFIQLKITSHCLKAMAGALFNDTVLATVKCVHVKQHVNTL